MAPHDPILPGLGIWGEPGPVLPLLGNSGPAPRYIWAWEPVSRWLLWLWCQGLLRSLHHLTGPEQLPVVALRPRPGELGCPLCSFLGGLLENKIFFTLPAGFKKCLRQPLNQDPTPVFPEPPGVERTRTLGADVEPLPSPSRSSLLIVVRQLHRGSVQSPLGVSFSSADPGEAMTPLANHDSGPLRGGHWVWPPKACEWYSPPSLLPKAETRVMFTCLGRPPPPSPAGCSPKHPHHLSLAAILGSPFPISQLSCHPSLLPSFLHSVVKVNHWGTTSLSCSESSDTLEFLDVQTSYTSFKAL